MSEPTAAPTELSRIAIQCTGITKQFRVPKGAETTLRGRVMHPRTRVSYDEFTALDDVSFEIRRGEFFGIVGRNGSGKSTLLKVLAGIYQPSSGTLEVNGSLAPFIELGVGFNMDLSAIDNVYVNGAILGMSRQALERQLPVIVDFAELQGFMEMKLRNFSSGMLMRLAFAIAVQADADILLVDEVLAVGDERFQRKCQDVFRERRRRGQTVVFVSHDMSAVEAFCDRAIVLHHGEVVARGAAAEVVPTYHRLNRDTDADTDQAKPIDPEHDQDIDVSEGGGLEVGGADDDAAHVFAPLVESRDSSSLDMRWIAARSELRTAVDPSDDFEFEVSLLLADHLRDPRLRLIVFNEQGGVVGEVHVPPTTESRLQLRIANSFTAGRYRIVGELFADYDGQDVLADSDALEVDVSGTPAVGSSRIEFDVQPADRSHSREASELSKDPDVD